MAYISLTLVIQVVHPMADYADRLDYLVLLRAAILQTHGCDSVHVQTVPVHEFLKQQTVWKGDVDVFNLTDHPEARRCFAWLQTDTGKSDRFVIVLEKPLVNTAEMAVKSAIFFDVQPAPRPNSRS